MLGRARHLNRALKITRIFHQLTSARSENAPYQLIYEMISRLFLFPRFSRLPGRLPGFESRLLLRRPFWSGLAGGPLFGGGFFPDGLLFGFCAGWFGSRSGGCRLRDFRDDLGDGPFGRLGTARLGFAPAVSFADGEHRGEDVVP